MFTSNTVANTLSNLQLAYLSKRLYVIMPYCNSNKQLLDKLCSVGYIQHYVVISEDGRFGFSAKVYLKYTNKLPTYTHVRCYWRLKLKSIVTLNNLKAVVHSYNTTTFLVYTDRGLLTDAECVRLGIGGVLVCGLFALLWNLQYVILL